MMLLITKQNLEDEMRRENYSESTKLEASLTFSSHWNGSPSKFPNYHVRLGTSAESGSLIVTIDSPFHNNPAPPFPKGKLDRLYEYEVVELFLSSINPEDPENNPYLEIQLGPHGHYMLVFFLSQADWENQDTTLELDFPPKVTMDTKNSRWTVEVAIPPHFLPEPFCGNDLSVTWNANATAAFNVGKERVFLSCHTLSGSEPNFHQLRCFRALTLFESSGTRELIRRSVSSRFEAQATDFAVEIDSPHRTEEEEEKDVTPLPVAEFAISLRDRILAAHPEIGTLDERFNRHVQKEVDEFVILHSVIWKRKGLSHKRRTLILTNRPRLFYLDGYGTYKGAVPWTFTQRIKIRKVSDKRFEIFVPDNNRVYYMYDGGLGADIWVNTITEILTAQKDYLRTSRKL